MTAEEKTTLACFFDTVSAYLGSGYANSGADYAFKDDPEAVPESQMTEGQMPAGHQTAAPKAAGAEPEADAFSIPLAYLVPEAAEDDSPLKELEAEIRSCTACPLAKTRTKAVPGEGPASPLVMVIGEGPGGDEDIAGRPFVGRAGQLLDKMLASAGLYREKNCYIANVVKCRPPGNRDPMPEEIACCAPYLERQIALLKPLLILCAGRVAARHILRTEEGIGRLRGKIGEYPAAVEIVETGTLQSDSIPPIPVIPTFHPSALLRDESLKHPAFEDLKQLMAALAKLDKSYAAEVKPLLAKYAAKDPAFAEKVRALSR
ncbi:MAG: uracil-DNA glycosylase [Treponema sp.]|jgi:DNA polymerase|nr:uracil-DNA glycosylase [Treponema sp.]